MFSTVYRIWEVGHCIRCGMCECGCDVCMVGVVVVSWGYSCWLRIQGCVLYMCGGVVWLSGWWWLLYRQGSH